LQNEYKDLIPLISTIELRDSYTQGHSQRVGTYAREFVKFLGYSQKTQDELFISGLLHDLGKIGIPDSILLKPTQLDPQEFDFIKLHSQISGEIVSTIPKYSFLSNAVRYHHENYDGSGYPHGLKGEKIPLYARILSLCDVWDALTTNRVYRSALSKEKTLKLLQKINNKFDPQLFQSFIPFITNFGIIQKETLGILSYPQLDSLRNNFFFTDPLTTLLNRDGILAVLQKTKELGFHVVFGEINIKGFKQYNQVYGLQKGDNLLKKLSTLLKSEFEIQTTPNQPKYKDLYVARVHADRFAILFISQRSDFLTFKLQKILEQFKLDVGVLFEFHFFIKNKPLPKNIEKELGYLL